MSIYKGLLFLDGFRVPAEYVEDVDASVPRTPVAEAASATRSARPSPHAGAGCCADSRARLASRRRAGNWGAAVESTVPAPPDPRVRLAGPLFAGPLLLPLIPA